MSMEMMHVSAIISSVLSNYGFTYEKLKENGAEKWYLKYRVFPSEAAISKLCLEAHIDTFEDEFFDTIEFRAANEGIFYRNRVGEAGTSFVKQDTIDIDTGNCHLYCEQVVSKDRECENEKLVSFLTYAFERRRSAAFPGVYMDTIVRPNVEYSVISIKTEIDDNANLEKGIAHILNVVSQLEDWNPELKFQLNDIIDCSQCRFFPVFSKFMFLAQMSPNYMMYFEKYEMNDPVRKCVDQRMEVVKESDQLPCYSKQYIWIMSYQIDFFQGLLQDGAINHYGSVDGVYETLKQHKCDVFEGNSFIYEELPF
jgi:hypothetical protein